LQHAHVDCVEDGGDAVVTVTGDALPVVANWKVHVKKEYSYPLEPGP
jgi:hypothetical protein